MQVQKLNEINKLKFRDVLKEIFIKNYFFIIFSFINLFLPIFATMMSALLGDHGALNVVQIGLTTSFISVFNQFLFLLSIALVFVFKNNSKMDLVDKRSISFIMFIYSIFVSILFVGTSLGYLYFSSAYENFSSSRDNAYSFILLLCPTFILNGFIYLSIIEHLDQNKFKALSTYLVFFVLNLIFIPIMYLYPNWRSDIQTIGIALGFNISSLLTLIYIIVINYNKENFNLTFSKNSLLYFFKKSSNFVVNFLLATIMKTFLVIAIALSMELGDKTIPPSLLIVKIVWYNSLFFCGFFADGIFYAIEYAKIKSLKFKKETILDIEAWSLIGLITFIGTAIITVVSDVTFMQLPDLYMSHQNGPISSELPNMLFKDQSISEQMKRYLWSPNSGELNVNLLNLDQIEYTPCYALLYLSIYHCLINTLKIISIKPIEIEDKFNWKKFLSNFLLLTFVMVFIASFGVAFNEFEGFVKTFNGIDSFSFALMCISIIMFIPTFLGFCIKFIKCKKEQNKNN